MDSPKKIEKILGSALQNTNFTLKREDLFSLINSHIDNLNKIKHFYNVKYGYILGTNPLMDKHIYWLGECLKNEENLHIEISYDIRKNKALPDNILSFYYALLVVSDEHGKKLKADCSHSLGLISDHVRGEKLFIGLITWHIDFFKLLSDKFVQFLPESLNRMLYSFFEKKNYSEVRTKASISQYQKKTERTLINRPFMEREKLKELANEVFNYDDLHSLKEFCRNNSLKKIVSKFHLNSSFDECLSIFLDNIDGNNVAMEAFLKYSKSVKPDFYEEFINENKTIANATNMLANKQDSTNEPLYTELQPKVKITKPKKDYGKKTVKIFLASSSELIEDRKGFREFISVENDRLHKEGTYLEIIQWEYFIDIMSRKSLQSEYNRAVKESDIFISLFFTKVGKYTLEEFENAFGQHKSTGRPFIYTYFKNDQVDVNKIKQEEINSKFEFEKKLKSLGHYPTSYANIDNLKYQFKLQLERILTNL